MALQLFITDDYEHMSRVGAGTLFRQINQKMVGGDKEFNLGGSTGISPIKLYDYFVKNQHKFDVSKMRTFNLDEYVGLPGSTPEERASHPESYERFMEYNLFSRLNPRFSESHIPPANSIDSALMQAIIRETPGIGYEGDDKGLAIIIPEHAPAYLSQIKQSMDDYISKIEAAGGIDTWIVGVGGKGHIGFHESGIPLNHDILLVKLDDNTIQNAVADRHFQTYEVAPKYAISMGAGGITRLSKNIILLASGERKAEPVARSLLEDTCREVPISILQQFAREGGKNATYIIDSAAAVGLIGNESKLRRRGVDIQDLR